MNIRNVALLTAIAAAAASTGVSAATDDATLTVNANVVASCTVAGGALDFGDIAPVTNVDFDASATVAVTCTNGAAYNVGLDAGSGVGATVSARQMTDGGSNTLNYALYSDAGRTTNWGNDGAGGWVGGTGSGASQSLTVYGRVPAGQQGAVLATYSDTVTVTVNF